MKADSETNIAAMASAIPAIEKGMGGAALLQMPIGDRLHKLVESYANMDPMDRRNVLGFLEQGSTSGDTEYTSSAGAGEILGILKQMKDEMEANLKSAVADEEKAVAGFAELKSSKEQEIELATEAIETKTARAGELAVSVVQTKNALEDSQEEVKDAVEDAVEDSVVDKVENLVSPSPISALTLVIWLALTILVANKRFTTSTVVTLSSPELNLSIILVDILEAASVIFKESTASIPYLSTTVASADFVVVT